ncbi:J domain-containing protein [Bdellovibrio sp. 22V]|uniref:J domain-containing protein n=1 Tax=Bdellovibrio TaxID=958 RepID=UPI002542A7AA|nr:J domain-containing protein [Bdellovibrio sp. 22V]WII71443.1 J domain-containing protein [Bdellovibrio sp. 22V]
MSFQASFKQILREKMGQNTASSLGNEASHLNSDPAHLAYLLGQIGRVELQTPRGHYPAPKVRPQRKPHSFSPSQRQAYEFMKSWIHDLSEGFTATELKKAFRQAALILHPDHGGNAQDFVNLKHQYEVLQSVVSI